jgi:hypothetical protein
MDAHCYGRAHGRRRETKDWIDIGMYIWSVNKRLSLHHLHPHVRSPVWCRPVMEEHSYGQAMPLKSVSMEKTTLWIGHPFLRSIAQRTTSALQPPSQQPLPDTERQAHSGAAVAWHTRDVNRS